MKLTDFDFEVIRLFFDFLCQMFVFEITVVLPHRYKNFENTQQLIPVLVSSGLSGC